MPPRASELFQSGLRANHDGRTLVACELIQRSAAMAGVPSLSVLLSLANMRLKLGQPSAALLAYRHTLSVADPAGRHAQMARRKLQVHFADQVTVATPSSICSRAMATCRAGPHATISVSTLTI